MYYACLSLTHMARKQEYVGLLLTSFVMIGAALDDTFVII